MIIDKGIPIKNVYYMLTYAFKELKRNNYEQIAGENFEDIHDLFAEILSLGIAYLLKQVSIVSTSSRKKNCKRYVESCPCKRPSKSA